MALPYCTPRRASRPPATCLASHQHVHTPLLINDQFIKDDVLLELCCQG